MSQILSFLPLLIWILIIIILIAAKKNFLQDEKKMGSISQLILLFFSVLIFGGVIGSYGWAYYKLYTATDGYAEIATQVNFEVYRPKYIPENFQLMEKFHLDTLKGVTSDSVVRAMYAPALTPQDATTPPPLLGISQFAETSTTSVESYVSFVTGNPNSVPDITQITLKDYNNAQLIKSPIIPLYTLVFSTSNGTVVVINGLRVSNDELLKVAESLE